MAVAAALACSGPKGDPGPQGDPGPTGPQGPAGTFSGTFNGNVTIQGAVSATNILGVETFTAWLTNAADFTAPTGTAPARLKYTDVKQNTNTAIFQPELDGNLTILKPGVISFTASFDAIGTGNFVRTGIRLNDTQDLGYSLSPSNGSNWAQVTETIHWKANANDKFSVLALPSEIANMDNGVWSTLNVQWTGVP
jgi:hypothetical protein